jgi:polysaccharide deacetylase 2 family uncharacterized protein YibQ
MIHWRGLLVAALTLLVSQSGANTTAKVAIIIDDLGYHLAAGRRAIDLPGPVAYAILPATPRAKLLARLANERGKEVLLHLPLEAVEPDSTDDPGGLLLDMSRASFAAAFAAAIESVPHAVGVSSHRGSLLTRHPGHMSWLMDEIGRRDGLFFIDSYTTHESVAVQLAKERGVAATRRDVFLDHERSAAVVQRELERLKRLARQRGRAVAIGHPYPETLDVLERELPRLANEGIELVAVSDLIT